MIDIVERLRDSSVWLLRDGFMTSAKNALDAADEINRLREVNSDLLEALQAIAGDGIQRVSTDLHEKARAAIIKALGESE